MGLIDLPQSKWGSGTGRQVILKGDFAKIEAAILQLLGLKTIPTITWVDATSIKVPATADSPAQIMMAGFPNILHPGMFVSGGLTDGRYRENTADATLDFDLAASLWGTEKVSQWYMIYALAGNADAVFTIKAMPFLRVKSQTTQTIKTGTLTTPASGIDYGFTGDELIGGMAYFLTGASRGLMRPITANAVDTDTTITYSGTALTVAAGDWFIVLPSANFRLIGTIFNNSAGDIVKFRRLGNIVQWMVNISCIVGVNAIYEDIRIACPLAVAGSVVMTTDNEIGHPDLTAAQGGHTGQSIVGTGWGNASFNLEFCRYYYHGSQMYSNYYSYPPGCGY